MLTNVWLMIRIKKTICMHNHLRMEIFCPSRDVNIIFFYQLTAISVVVLVKAIAEA